MEVDIIFKIAAIGLAVAIINTVLSRAGKEEIALMTTLTGLLIVIFMIIGEFGRLFDTIKSIFGL